MKRGLKCGHDCDQTKTRYAPLVLDQRLFVKRCDSSWPLIIYRYEKSRKILYITPKIKLQNHSFRTCLEKCSVTSFCYNSIEAWETNNMGDKLVYSLPSEKNEILPKIEKPLKIKPKSCVGGCTGTKTLLTY